MFPFFLQWHKLGLQTDNDIAASFWVFNLFQTVVYSEGMESHRPLFAFAMFKHRTMAAKRQKFCPYLPQFNSHQNQLKFCYTTQGAIGSIARRENCHSTYEVMGHVTSIVPVFFQQ